MWILRGIVDQAGGSVPTFDLEHQRFRAKVVHGVAGVEKNSGG
jgi:hypothetical protein